MSVRPDWDDYFMAIARQVATRSTCAKRAVGCVIVRDNIILSTGYNGSVREGAHCTDDGIGCLLNADGDCIRTVHAEANAVAQAAQTGSAILGATAYTTVLPCWGCYKLFANAGIVRCYGVKRKPLDYDLVSPTMSLLWDEVLDAT